MVAQYFRQQAGGHSLLEGSARRSSEMARHHWRIRNGAAPSRCHHLPTISARRIGIAPGSDEIRRAGDRIDLRSQPRRGVRASGPQPGDSCCLRARHLVSWRQHHLCASSDALAHSRCDPRRVELCQRAQYGGELRRARSVRIGTRVRLGATVTRVEHTNSGVAVTYEKDGKLWRTRGRKVVMASPGWLNRHILADLPGDLREAYDEFHYGPAMSVNVAL